jgi:8-oxo-dGTP pyrophosphatase MutT (NUDIX family)
MTVVPQAGAIAMRSQDGRTHVLIVRAKKDPSKWIFPKGHIEPGETPAETAVRELAEEAGVRGTVVCPVGVSTFQSGKERVEVTFYLVRFKAAVQAAEEREVKWLPADEARRTLSFDDSRRLLDDAVRAFGDGVD